jgi:NTE family protein
MIKRCDAVFEGGGVKGTGFAGAVAALEEAGYQFQNLVGTSAGAIVAALVAAGCDSAEIRWETQHADYRKFKDANAMARLGLLGKSVNAAVRFGIYKGDYFEHWLDRILQRKGKRVFGDIRTGAKEDQYKYKFQAVASDLTDKKMLLLPNDLRRFGLDPEEYSIAKVVRMSMSLPLYFKPVFLKDMDGRVHMIVDGGLLSNYPIWVLDDGTENPPWPTFGMKFYSNRPNEEIEDPRKNILEYTKAVFSTLMEAHDRYHISTSRGDYQRTIFIPTCVESNGLQKCVHTTYFEITDGEKQSLYENGRGAAREFLRGWDFGAWKRRYRE